MPVDMAIQTYQRPSVQTSDKRICNPSLGGIASKGGTVTSYGGQQQMDVKYNCLKQGSATITVTVPMQAYEAVTFSWTKVCRKEQVQGWMIGTAPSEDDVVSDGQPWIYFDSHPSAEGKRMIVDRETPQSTFFVWSGLPAPARSAVWAAARVKTVPLKPRRGQAEGGCGGRRLPRAHCHRQPRRRLQARPRPDACCRRCRLTGRRTRCERAGRCRAAPR